MTTEEGTRTQEASGGPKVVCLSLNFVPKQQNTIILIFLHAISSIVNPLYKNTSKPFCLPIPSVAKEQARRRP